MAHVDGICQLGFLGVVTGDDFVVYLAIEVASLAEQVIAHGDMQVGIGIGHKYGL